MADRTTHTPTATGGVEQHKNGVWWWWINVPGWGTFASGASTREAAVQAAKAKAAEHGRVLVGIEGER